VQWGKTLCCYNTMHVTRNACGNITTFTHLQSFRMQLTGQPTYRVYLNNLHYTRYVFVTRLFAVEQTVSLLLSDQWHQQQTVSLLLSDQWHQQQYSDQHCCFPFKKVSISTNLKNKWTKMQPHLHSGVPSAEPNFHLLINNTGFQMIYRFKVCRQHACQELWNEGGSSFTAYNRPG
jgi:hypothetical protein